jgi:hypothetical protein
MSIGVFSIYGKIFLAYSPETLNAFSVFSVQVKILLAYSETTLYTGLGRTTYKFYLKESYKKFALCVYGE